MHFNSGNDVNNGLGIDSQVAAVSMWFVCLHQTTVDFTASIGQKLVSESKLDLDWLQSLIEAGLTMLAKMAIRWF